MTAVRSPMKLMEGGNIKTVDVALYLVDEVVSNLSSCNLQNGVILLNLTSLVNYLQNHGSAVEAVCRDQLDRAFVRFRKSSLDTKTDFCVRKLMLYLIEMRANNWVPTESSNRYYKNDEYLMSNMPDNVGNNAGTVPAMISPTLPILAPGETIKSSGKYLAPTKIPGKNYFKDEVVIRNSDSGKVMGIKGRRVHMIEELSETVISFQRVNPGAKERLVQVTGPDEAHINYAQQLMGDTIRRNASPVPFRPDQADIERVGGSSSSVNSSASDESTRIQGYPRAKLHHSLSSNDATMDAYKYTVKVGGNSVKITGSDYSLVMKSKLALDKFFESEPEQVEINEFFTSFDDEVSPSTPSLLPEPHLEFTTKPELTRVERPVSAFAAFREPVPPAAAEPTGRKYSRFALCMMAGAEICKEPPVDWETVCPAVLRKPGGITKIINDFLCTPVLIAPQPPIQTTIPFRPKMYTRSKSELTQDKSSLSDAAAAAEASIHTTKIPKEQPSMATQDEDTDDSVIFPSPLSLSIPSLLSPRSFAMSLPTAEFHPIPAPLSSPITPYSPSPRTVSSPISNFGTPPLSPMEMYPATTPSSEQEPGEVIIRTTIPFRPKLTNPKLSFLSKN